jgi:hypothetical protein
MLIKVFSHISEIFPVPKHKRYARKGYHLINSAKNLYLYKIKARLDRLLLLELTTYPPPPIPATVSILIMEPAIPLSWSIFYHVYHVLKALSHDIDFKKFDNNLQN